VSNRLFSAANIPKDKANIKIRRDPLCIKIHDTQFHRYLSEEITMLSTPTLITILLWMSKVHSISLDSVLIEDMVPQGSAACGNKDGSTTTSSFNYTASGSFWDTYNAAYEPKTFLASLHHEDNNPNRTYTVRFGKGGNIYSLIGPYGEAIPPQGLAGSPFNDEVLQSVSVPLNRLSDYTAKFFVHQAGMYNDDQSLGGVPFYSPNVAKSCYGNECSFVTFGQVAKRNDMSSYKSDILFMHR